MLPFVVTVKFFLLQYPSVARELPLIVGTEPQHVKREDHEHQLDPQTYVASRFFVSFFTFGDAVA